MRSTVSPAEGLKARSAIPESGGGAILFVDGSADARPVPEVFPRVDPTITTAIGTGKGRRRIPC